MEPFSALVESSFVAVSALSYDAVAPEYSKFIKCRNVRFDFDDVRFLLKDFQTKLHPDDVAYKNRNVWEMLPRGKCLVYSGKQLVCNLSGVPKFGWEGDIGTYGNPLPPGAEPFGTSEIFMTKENGSAAHIASFFFRDKYYFVGGSKNRHSIVRNMSDVLALPEEESYVRRIFTLFFALGDETVMRIAQFLSTTGLTLAGEAIFTEEEHLVKYDTDKIVFFALTKPRSVGDSLTMDPQWTLAKFDEFGISRPAFRILSFDTEPFESQRARREMIREVGLLENSEGCVVYRMVGDQVFQMYKVKNWLYMILRAVREKIRGKATVTNMLARIKELQESSEGLNEVWMKEEPRIREFFSWVMLQPDSVRNDIIEKRYISSWLAFGYDGTSRFESQLKEGQSQVRIVMVGAQGSGKSTMARILAALLPSSKWINQDEFEGNSKLYGRAIEAASSAKDIRYIIIDKTHCPRDQRQRTLANLRTEGKLVWVVFKNQDVDFLESRIKARGESHKSFLYTEGKDTVESRI